MSSSDLTLEPDARIAEAVALLMPLIETDEIGRVSDAAIRALVGSVLRVYEHACANARREIVPVGGDISTTAAITLACALARSQSLTPFDLALWFSHTAPRDVGADAPAPVSLAGGLDE